VLDNKNLGGFAALSYTATDSLSDFYLETWVYPQAPMARKARWLASLFLSILTGNFYRLATQFISAEPWGRKAGTMRT